MIRKAIVAGIGENTVELLTLDEIEKDHDESCGGESCGSPGCGCRVSGRPFLASRPEGLDIQVGNTVEVQASGKKALGAGFLVLGLPPAAGLAAWFGVGNLFPGTAEGVRTLITMAAAVTVIAPPMLLGGRGKNDRLPEITAVLG